MNLIQLWCQNNHEMLLFVYGLVFIVMANSIQLQSKKDSKFEIANIFGLLTAFALIQATLKFIDMWAEIKGGYLYLDRVRWFILAVSYFLFFEFGRRLLRLAKVNPSSLRGRITKKLNLWLSIAIWAFVIFSAFISNDFAVTGPILAGYLFCLPAGLLIGSGFMFYYRDLKETLAYLKVKKYFLVSGISFAIYGLLEGLIVPRGEFFPAIWLNEKSFVSVVHLPVEIFRAACSIAGTVGILGMLKIFNWEKTKKIEDALTVREKIAEGIDEAIILIDNDFRVIWANKKATQIYGELVGECYYYDYAAHYSLKQENGTRVSPSNTCPIVEALTRDDSNTMLHTYVDEKGENNYVEVSAYPIRDLQNNIIEFVHVARDVTERVRAEESVKKAYSELKKAQQDLIQAEKLASLGRFSLGVAHEVKNPLAIILSGVEFLELKCQNTDPDLIKATGAIKDAVFRADEIVRRLLKFSKPDQLKIERIKPDELIKEATSLFKYSTPPANIQIKTEFSSDEMYIEVDKNQIQQVVFNLILNSVEAMPKGGELCIRTYKSRTSELQLPACIIEVSDTGEGISRENLSRVFEPFFTTKRDIRGTGLGLSISRTIVNNHKGELMISSELNKGTTVKIVLPLA